MRSLTSDPDKLSSGGGVGGGSQSGFTQIQEKKWKTS